MYAAIKATGRKKTKERPGGVGMPTAPGRWVGGRCVNQLSRRARPGPVTVALKLDYAVCDKICVPAKGEARLWLEPGVTSVTSPRLEEFEARVPLPVKLGLARERLSIIEVTRGEKESEHALKLILKAPEGGAIDDVFVEGAGQWSFGRPQLTPLPDGSIAAKLRIVERPKGASGLTPFIVTLSGRPAPVETRLELDISAGKP